MKVPEFPITKGQHIFEPWINCVGQDHLVAFNNTALNVYHEATKFGIFMEQVKVATRDSTMCMNCIHCRYADTPLADIVTVPDIVKKLDIRSIVSIDPKKTFDAVDVTKSVDGLRMYLILSMRKAVTGYHYDFTGTDAYYHQVTGRKKFSFIAPLESTLALVMESEKESTEDQTTHAYTTELKLLKSAGITYELMVEEGDTLFIPGPWIHKVTTDATSVALAGNFLRVANIGTALPIYLHERELGEDDCYPYFVALLAIIMPELIRLGRLKEVWRSKENILKLLNFEFEHDQWEEAHMQLSVAATIGPTVFRNTVACVSCIYWF